MTATSTILAGGIAVIGGSCALVGAVAVLASPGNRRRTARALAAESERADRIARAIMLGEQDARDAHNHLALASACACALQRLIPAEPPAVDWWTRGIDGICTPPVPVPDDHDALRVAACMQYCLDLAQDRLRAEGRGDAASRRAVKPMGAFLVSGMLEQIDGWTHLETHRTAGMYDLAGHADDPPPVCPFCGHGRYDQTLMRCDQCATVGELTRTVPAVPLPRRTAPDLKAAAYRAADIEARAFARLHASPGSDR